MQEINFEKEFKYIQEETHNNKPTKANRKKRELLLFMQSYLSKITNDIERDIYYKTKSFYQSL